MLLAGAHQNALLFRITIMANKIPPALSSQLLGKILDKIAEEKRKAAILKLIYSSLGVVASGICFVIVGNFFRSELSASGFVEYLHILFSDSGVAFLYWKDFMLFALEFFPVTAATTFLLDIVAFLGLSRVMIQSTKLAFVSQ